VALCGKCSRASSTEPKRAPPAVVQAGGLNHWWPGAERTPKGRVRTRSGRNRRGYMCHILAQSAFLRARRGFTAPFTPLEAGTVVITWIAEPPRAPRTRKRAATPIPVATGEETFDLAEPKPMNVEVTAAGERLLKRLARRSRVTLTVHATFSGYWAGPIEVSAHQQLARAPWH
jgi:hypothetical protein